MVGVGHHRSDPHPPRTELGIFEFPSLVPPEEVLPLGFYQSIPGRVGGLRDLPQRHRGPLIKRIGGLHHEQVAWGQEPDESPVLPQPEGRGRVRDGSLTGQGQRIRTPIPDHRLIEGTLPGRAPVRIPRRPQSAHILLGRGGGYHGREDELLGELLHDLAQHRGAGEVHQLVPGRVRVLVGEPLHRIVSGEPLVPAIHPGPLRVQLRREVIAHQVTDGRGAHHHAQPPPFLVLEFR